jgi:hypothetical protein
MYRLYDFLASGNGYKCRLLLHHLDLPFERVEVDILRGESRTEAFGRLNPEQRIPVLELEDDTSGSEPRGLARTASRISAAFGFMRNARRYRAPRVLSPLGRPTKRRGPDCPSGSERGVPGRAGRGAS